MDFQPSADQQELAQGIRSFCEARIPLEALPQLALTQGFDRKLWSELAELGVFALRLPESEGGLGLGMADAALAFEQLGRRLAPGPTVFSELAAGLVDGVATGETLAGGLDLCASAATPYLVEHRAALDVLLLLRESGVYRVESAELETKSVATPLDPLTPIALAEHLPAGERIAGPEAAQSLRWQGMTLCSALLLGVAEATLELALDYAKQREQFGRTIGSFQSIKHMLADMFARQELARAAVYAAAATLDHPEVGDVERAARGAKIIAGESAMKNARACIQIHGGMGYTWEVPAHYYLKRCWVLENGFGNSEEHCLRAGEMAALQAAAGA